MSEETPQEQEALAKLDEATREVASQELDKEIARESTWTGGLGRVGVLGMFRFPRFTRFRRQPGDPVPEPVDNPDPVDEHGLRDALHGDADKQ